MIKNFSRTDRLGYLGAFVPAAANRHQAHADAKTRLPGRLHHGHRDRGSSRRRRRRRQPTRSPKPAMCWRVELDLIDGQASDEISRRSPKPRSAISRLKSRGQALKLARGYVVKAGSPGQAGAVTISLRQICRVVLMRAGGRRGLPELLFACCGNPERINARNGSKNHTTRRLFADLMHASIRRAVLFRSRVPLHNPRPQEAPRSRAAAVWLRSSSGLRAVAKEEPMPAHALVNGRLPRLYELRSRSRWLAIARIEDGQDCVLPQKVTAPDEMPLARSTR